VRWNRHSLTQKFSYHTHKQQAASRFAHKHAAAAVLIPIYETNEGLQLLFTVRASHLRHHPGQISFPGGKFDVTDSSLAETALRESEEEIGLPRESVELIGHLPPMHTNSGFRVSPYLGFVGQHPPLVINYQEVDETFCAPFDYFLSEHNHIHHRVKHKSKSHDVYFMPWQQRNVWGVTAAILRSLYEHLK